MKALVLVKDKILVSQDAPKPEKITDNSCTMPKKKV